jgi:F0F1-type ATP synthase membrane subunit b/b'
MSISVEMTVVFSFIGFCFLFAKKIYPLITKGLDAHIDSVKNQIKEAEDLKAKASEALQLAYSRKDETIKIIQENERVTSEKIQRMYEENEQALNALRTRQEIALENQLKAEFQKQKEKLIDRIADLVVNKLTEKIESRECKIPTNFTKEDLRKLI